MDIIWLGHSCFRLRGREATVLFDPYGGQPGVQALARQTADLVCLSNPHPNHSHEAALENAPENAPPILRGPGEYEVKGVSVTGLSTLPPGSEPTAPRNTAYRVEIDDVAVCHLGDLAQPAGTGLRELLRAVDVLLIPVGGHCTINAAGAAETISLIEPKYVVPMHYGSPAGDPPLDSLDRFLREMGLTEIEAQNRLSVTRNSLPEATQIVILDVRR